MPTAVTIRVNVRPVNAALRAFATTIGPRPVLLMIAGYMRFSIMKTFQTEGTGYGNWAPLAPSTIARRRNRNKGSIKILQDTGRLKNSINYDISGSQLRISTNVVYAAAQQFGTKGRVAGTRPSIMHRLASGLFGNRIRGNVRSARGGIPARPFIVFRPEDPENIRKRTAAFIQQMIRRSGLGKSEGEGA